MLLGSSSKSSRDALESQRDVRVCTDEAISAMESGNVTPLIYSDEDKLLIEGYFII